LEEITARLKFLPKNRGDGAVTLGKLKEWTNALNNIPKHDPRWSQLRKRNSYAAAPENPRRETDTYRIACGFKETGSEQWCPGNLGRLLRFADGGPLKVIDHAAEDIARLTGDRKPRDDGDLYGNWYVSHPELLSPTDDGAHKIVRSKRVDRHGQRVGRRPLPEAIRTPPHPRLYKPKQIVGRLPVTPTVIICPVCNRRNYVPEPETPQAP